MEYREIYLTKNMQVKINESYGTVIGRICMDQLLIDISSISNVKVGDIITIIGEDDNITAEQVADKADTITNECYVDLETD